MGRSVGKREMGGGGVGGINKTNGGHGEGVRI